jgi:hypothetical protein
MMRWLRDGLADHWSRILRGKNGRVNESGWVASVSAKSSVMEVVMDNQDLQNSVAKIAETLITTQRNLVTVSRSLWAVRISIRELHPDFEQRYLHHFAEPEHAFETMRDNLLEYGRELANIARRLRAESSQ